jgi:solute carrier family 25 phosphate transporter 3
MPSHQPRNGNVRSGSGNVAGTTRLRSIFTYLTLLSHVTSAKTASSIASSIDYRYFVAGGTCAAISHGITTPIDVVKTRMQSNPEKYRNILDTTSSIIREEGPSALVAGLGPTLVGYGIEGALKFGVYEVTKPLVVLAFREFGLSKAGARPGMLPFLLASIMAGAVASLVLVPMESTRIRMVTDPDFANVGLLGGLGRLVEESGFVRTLTVGMGAMLAKQVRENRGGRGDGLGRVVFFRNSLFDMRD